MSPTRLWTKALMPRRPGNDLTTASGRATCTPRARSTRTMARGERSQGALSQSPDAPGQVRLPGRIVYAPAYVLRAPAQVPERLMHRCRAVLSGRPYLWRPGMCAPERVLPHEKRCDDGTCASQDECWPGYRECSSGWVRPDW